MSLNLHDNMVSGDSTNNAWSCNEDCVECMCVRVSVRAHVSGITPKREHFRDNEITLNNWKNNGNASFYGVCTEVMYPEPDLSCCETDLEETPVSSRYGEKLIEDLGWEDLVCFVVSSRVRELVTAISKQ
jgi:hypothetical protein